MHERTIGFLRIAVLTSAVLVPWACGTEDDDAPAGDGPPAEEVCEENEGGYFQVSYTCVDKASAGVGSSSAELADCAANVRCAYRAGAVCEAGHCEVSCCSEALMACDIWTGSLCD